MTAAAQSAELGQLGLDAGIFGVSGQGTVAGLTGKKRVFAALPDFGDVAVAGIASRAARIFNGMSANIVERAWTEVAVLAEALRYHGAAHNEECADGGCQQQNEPYQMSGVLPYLHWPPPGGFVSLGLALSNCPATGNCHNIRANE